MNPLASTLLLALIAMNASVLAESEPSIREAEPGSCYLKSYGKGPDGMAALQTEFELSAFKTRTPYVSDRFAKAESDAFKWRNTASKHRVSELAKIDGRKVVRIDFAGDKGNLPADKYVPGEIPTWSVVIAIESSAGSGWYRPFTVATPELLRTKVVPHKEAPTGVVVSLHYSGNGLFRTHLLFELTDAHPKLVDTVHCGRIRRNYFENDQDYQEALKSFDHEEAILSGKPRDDSDRSAP